MLVMDRVGTLDVVCSRWGLDISPGESGGGQEQDVSSLFLGRIRRCEIEIGCGMANQHSTCVEIVLNSPLLKLRGTS
ncbi:hypothetical protein B0O80DRAFT_460318 [Mortierella sp. GBAus27b]|nr:hypothetical protein B0O80DRAFT_460318 [Mortierella sp. GBAus27b]